MFYLFLSILYYEVLYKPTKVLEIIQLTIQLFQTLIFGPILLLIFLVEISSINLSLSLPRVNHYLEFTHDSNLCFYTITTDACIHNIHNIVLHILNLDKWYYAALSLYNLLSPILIRCLKFNYINIIGPSLFFFFF